MLYSNQDLSARLISEDSIRQHLLSIFQDSIIVDLKFNIILVSQNVLDFLEFSNEELTGKNLNYLAGDTNLTAFLEKSMCPGFFTEEKIILFSKGNHPSEVSASGFYLGLVNNLNGYIILKIKNLQELNVVNQQLQKRKAELDKFIYRVAHDIRGPLATIQGLINLVKIREDNSEVDRLIQMMDAHAAKLDERLFQMVYLAQADDEEHEAQCIIDFSDIETNLRKVIVQNTVVDFLDFHFQAPEIQIRGINEIIVQSLLANILLYLLSLPKQQLHNKIFFRCSDESLCLKLTIEADGFVVNENLKKAINQEASIYTDILNYPRLLNFFAAQKIAWKLNAKITLNVICPEKQRIEIRIPKQE